MGEPHGVLPLRRQAPAAFARAFAERQATGLYHHVSTECNPHSGYVKTSQHAERHGFAVDKGSNSRKQLTNLLNYVILLMSAS